MRILFRNILGIVEERSLSLRLKDSFTKETIDWAPAFLPEPHKFVLKDEATYLLCVRMIAKMRKKIALAKQAQ